MVKQVVSKVRIKVMGKEYIPLLLTLRKRRVRVRGKEYVQYYINIPREVGEYFDKEIEEELGALPLIALIRPAEWYHLLNWEEIEEYARKKLPKEIREELEALGFLPEEGPKKKEEVEVAA